MRVAFGLEVREGATAEDDEGDDAKFAPSLLLLLLLLLPHPKNPKKLSTAALFFLPASFAEEPGAAASLGDAASCGL